MVSYTSEEGGLEWLAIWNGALDGAVKRDGFELFTAVNVIPVVCLWNICTSRKTNGGPYEGSNKKR